MHFLQSYTKSREKQNFISYLFLVGVSSAKNTPLMYLLSKLIIIFA